MSSQHVRIDARRRSLIVAGASALALAAVAAAVAVVAQANGSGDRSAAGAFRGSVPPARSTLPRFTLTSYGGAQVSSSGLHERSCC